MIEEVVDLAKQINLGVNIDEVQELLDFRNQELTIDELIEMHETSRMLMKNYCRNFAHLIDILVNTEKDERRCGADTLQDVAG
ncbi:hypothetical protein TNCV_1584021 [Trichonephila clavipes]|nr:hypothetical protein TNCV_1584021 [Trichonephila clavipes]